MRLALEQAERARCINEIPVGCIIIDENEVILSRAHNLTNSLNDPTAHAELIAIRKASELKGSWRLENCTLYATLEPCIMCAGAIINSRIKNTVYGTADEKSGAVTSKYTIFDDDLLNHKVGKVSGILDKECSKILTDFFRNLREQKKSYNSK